jgi:hypothetical protein
MTLPPLPPDFAEMLRELSGANAEFLIVGAYAVGAHVQPRATQDLDIWVRATPENAVRVWRALARFGAPLHELTLEDLSAPGIVFQIGRAPNRIDILTTISGVTFDEAWPERVIADLGGESYPVLGRNALITNKRASGRDKDLIDLGLLERFSKP